MKRLLATLLLSLYLFFSGSWVLAYHYCGDVLVETRINAKAHCCCESSENVAANNDDDCCHDEVKPVKQPDTNVQSAKAPMLHAFVLLPQHPWVPRTPSCVVSASRSQKTHIHPPPDITGDLPAFIQYHALLLYA